MNRPQTDHLAAWPARPSLAFTSTLASDQQMRAAEHREARGLAQNRDAHRVAVYRGVEVWHTELTSAYTYPSWPPGHVGARLIYRGFDFDKLETVLTTGLDYSDSSAFFGSTYMSKAWEYPPSREMAAMMIFDQHRLQPSWALPGVGVDPTAYECNYLGAGGEVYTHFPRGRGTRTFLDEEMYGYFAPDSPRDALLGVLIGSERPDCRRLLPDLPGVIFDSVLVREDQDDGR